MLVHVASHAEAVNDAAVQVDLIRLLGGFQDLFRFVSFRGCEDLVCFCRGMREAARKPGVVTVACWLERKWYVDVVNGRRR